MVALVLFLHISERIQCTAFVKFIDHHYVGKIQHVYLFQLCSSTVFRCHYIHAHIAVVSYLCIALADARCFQYDQVVMRSLQDVYCIQYVLGYGQVALAGSHRAHIHAAVADSVHADTVAKQCTACLPLRRVNRDDAYVLVFKVYQEAANDLINQRAFTGTSCACNTQHRCLGFSRLLCNILHSSLRLRHIVEVLSSRYQAGNRFYILFNYMAHFAIQLLPGREVALLQQVVYHTLQAHTAAIIGAVDAADAVSLQFGYLIGQYNAAAAAKYLYMSATRLFQQVVHVFEVFYVATLVAGNSYSVGIFLYSTIYHLLHTAVVAQVNNLGTTCLHHAAHDIDRGIVAVEKGCRRNKAHFIPYRIRHTYK